MLSKLIAFTLATLCTLTGPLVGQEELPLTLKKALLEDPVYKKLTEDPQDDGVIRSTIYAIPAGVAETPDFWAKLASNDKFSHDRRSFAIYMLFQRHIRPGMTVPQLAKLLASITWPEAAEVVLVGAMSGPPHPAIWQDGVLFRVLVDSKGTGSIYIAFERPSDGTILDERVLLEILNGKPHPELASIHLADLRVTSKWLERDYGH